MVRDLSTQLAELGLTLEPATLVSLERLVDELLHWNARRNLTAITARDEIIEKHLVDSLTVLPFAQQAMRLLDLGSGAGFPSLPLKIVCPSLEVVAVDSVEKKIDFHRHVKRLLQLEGYTAVAARIEALAQDAAFRCRFDLVTARALSRLDQVVTLAAPFLAPGGRLIAMKGPEGRDEVLECGESLAREGWSVHLHERLLPVSGARRCLVELTRI